MTPNTEAIYREYPFLETYFPEKVDITKARISRITDEFLGQCSGHWFYDGDGTAFSSNGKIILLDEHGNLLTQVGVRKVQKRFLFRKFFSLRSFAETVGQALLRLGRDASAHYAVWLKNDGELILYKSPKDFTIQEWYEEQIRRSEQSVRDSVNAINNEANR